MDDSTTTRGGETDERSYEIKEAGQVGGTNLEAWQRPVAGPVGARQSAHAARGVASQ